MEFIDRLAKSRKDTSKIITIEEPPIPGRAAMLTVSIGSTHDKMLEKMLADSEKVFLTTLKAPQDMDSSSNVNFYDVGATGSVESVVIDDVNGIARYVLMPFRRARISAPIRNINGFGEAGTEELFHDLSDSDYDDVRVLAVTATRMFDDLREKIARQVNGIPTTQRISQADKDVIGPLDKMSEGGHPPWEVADLLTENIPTLFKPNVALMQRVIEQDKTADRLQALIDFMAGMEKEFDMSVRIQTEAKDKYNKAATLHFLKEEKVRIDNKIKELDPDQGEDEDDLEVLKKKIDASGMPEGVNKEVAKGLKKLKKMDSAQPGYHVEFKHLEFLAEIPWNKSSVLNNDIVHAQAVLDEDHYGLEKVKEEIIEHLAVLARPEASGKGKIICLVGPPGVGKTSIGKSIAKATGREFVRVSLGGVDDEAMVRGHTRTYVGALPGRIAEAIKKAGTNNPMMQLDEVDKTQKNQMRGSVDNALLELLDPEQNSAFRDNYMGVEMDLSKVLFVCTANYPDDIPPALKDRMEIVSLSGYLDEQKFEIAKRYLVAKQMKQAGLSADQFSVTDDALRDIVNYYTKEAGVRKLEQRIGKLCSKTAVMIAMNKIEKAEVTSENLTDFLGERRYSNDLARKAPAVGIVTGLAYTEVGGDTLSIEAVKYPGANGSLITTGNLQKVIDESVRVAVGLAKSRAVEFGIDPKVIKENDIQVHFPAGATPKDGPSAGAAITTAIVSLLTGRKVRNDLAMTGEINLSGMVTEIGGLAQKFQAAVKGGIKTVLVPQANMKDVAEIPRDITDKLEIIPVETIDEVLRNAFVSVADQISAQRQPFLKPVAHLTSANRVAFTR